MLLSSSQKPLSGRSLWRTVLAVGEFVMDMYYLSSIWMHLPVKDLESSNTVQANYQDKEQNDDGEGKKQMLEGHGHF